MRRLSFLVVLAALAGGVAACGPTAGGADSDGGGSIAYVGGADMKRINVD